MFPDKSGFIFFLLCFLCYLLFKSFFRILFSYPFQSVSSVSSVFYLFCSIYSRQFVFIRGQNIFSVFSLSHNSQLATRNSQLFLCLLCFFVATFFLFFPAVTTHFHLRKSAKSADKKSVLIRHIRPPAADPRAINLPFFCDLTFAQKPFIFINFCPKHAKTVHFRKIIFRRFQKITQNRRILGVFRQKLTKGGNPVFNTNQGLTSISRNDK